MNKKILVINQYNSDNLGDKLLNKSLIDELTLNNFDCNNLGYAQTTEQTINYTHNYGGKIISFLYRIFPEELKYKLKYKARLTKQLDSINSEEYSAIIIGGGQLLKHNSVFSDCLRFWIDWASENQLLTCLYGVGVDNNLSIKEENFYSEILKHIDYINCRDIGTSKILKELSGRNVRISPDVAFTMKNSTCRVKHNKVLVMPYSYEIANKHFSLNRSREHYFCDILNMIPNEFKNDCIYISATTSSDAYESILFQKFLDSKGIKSKIIEAYTVDDLIDIISKFKYVITGRMHAMIVCSVVGTKIIPIRISNKIDQFLKEYDNDYVDINKAISESKKGVYDLASYIKEKVI